MSAVVWEDPPGASRGALVTAELVEFAATLRENPKRWALYPRPLGEASSRTETGRINHGRSVAFPSGFEATSRGGKLYVRFVGEDAS